MKIKLTLATQPGPRDFAVTADAMATVGDVAETIERSLASQAMASSLTLESSDS